MIVPRYGQRMTPRDARKRADDPGGGIEALRQAIALKGKPRQSPLYVWLFKRQTAFAAFLAKERPTWQAVVEGLAAQGFTNQDGTPLNPATVRNLWWRVRQSGRKGKGQAEGQPTKAAPADDVRPIAPAPATAAPVVCNPEPAQPGAAFNPLEGEDEARPIRRFGTSKIPE